MGRKEFSKEADNFGRKAELAVKEYLQKIGYSVIDHEFGRMGKDLTAIRNGVRRYIEVDRRSKKIWGEGAYRFSTIHVLGRRVFDPGTVLISCRYDLRMAIMLRAEDILDFDPVKKDCKFVKDEPIREVPVSRGVFIDLQETSKTLDVLWYEHLVKQGEYVIGAMC